MPPVNKPKLMYEGRRLIYKILETAIPKLGAPGVAKLPKKIIKTKNTIKLSNLSVCRPTSKFNADISEVSDCELFIMHII